MVSAENESSHFDPEDVASLLSFHQAVSAVAGFDLPEEVAAQFRAIHSDLTQEPRSPALDRLLPTDAGKPDWLARLTNKILGDVQEGIAACHYHLENLSRLECALAAAAEAARPLLAKNRLNRTVVAGGNTRALNFEYQAFHITVRRTLEYFASSVAAFFKQDGPGIRRLVSALARAEPETERAGVAEVMAAHRNAVSALLSTGTDITVRDRIVHWEPVDAGVFNVIYGPSDSVMFGIAGGGEDLDLFDSDDSMGGVLSQTLANTLGEVETLLFSVYQRLGLGTGA